MSLAVPARNGTCCATTINVGPSTGSGQLQEVRDGYFYYYANKSVSIGNITACANDAANPDKRKNTSLPDEERLYKFKLSVKPTCDGKSKLNVKQEQARPLTQIRTRRLPRCAFGAVVNTHIAAKYPASTQSTVESP